MYMDPDNDGQVRICEKCGDPFKGDICMNCGKQQPALKWFTNNYLLNRGVIYSFCMPRVALLILLLIYTAYLIFRLLF